MAPVRELRFRDFRGGLNLRDAQAELNANESPDLWNVTLDEHGSVGKRLGRSLRGQAVVSGGNKPNNAFYWQTNQLLIVQAGTGLFKETTPGTFVSFKTFSTGDRCGLADFAGKLCITHPVDGFFTYDGTTLTAVGAGPKGDSLAPWQNKLWSNDKSGTAPARVNISAAADPTSWPASIDLREKDNAQVVCLGGAPGQDVTGKPGLLAFKRRSTHRIYDSTSGAYTTIDGDVGAASSLAVVSREGVVYAISEAGVFATNGVGRMKAVGDKLNPLWDSAALNFGKLDLFCAGAKLDRIYFSVPRAGVTANNLTLEFHPGLGWFTANSNAASCYAVYGKDDQVLISGSPTVDGTFYKEQTGGTDDGTAIASYFQTPWFEPNGGMRALLNQLRITGRGSYTIYTRRDYEIGQGLARSVAINRGGFVWNAGGSTWNQAGVIWGPAQFTGGQQVYSLGPARAFSFRVEETSSATQTQPTLINGLAPIVGAWGLYGLDLYTTPLGRA